MMQRSPQQRCEERLAKRAGMVAYVVAKLNLTADQRPLLDKLQGVLQGNADKERQLCATLKPIAERGQETVLDRMNRRAHSDLLKLIEEKPGSTQQAMNGILVAKNLERIADHASNIATDVIFWIRGADVRHQLSMSVD